MSSRQHADIPSLSGHFPASPATPTVREEVSLRKEVSQGLKNGIMLIHHTLQTPMHIKSQVAFEDMYQKDPEGTWKSLVLTMASWKQNTVELEDKAYAVLDENEKLAGVEERLSDLLLDRIKKLLDEKEHLEGLLERTDQATNRNSIPTEVQQKEQQYLVLRTENNKLQQQYNTLKEQFDALFQLIESQNQATVGSRGSSVATSATKPSKSERVPDPPMFSGGRELNLNGWRFRIEEKLDINADRYYTAKQRMAYVASRCTGEAALQIESRRHKDAIKPYKDAPDILDHLGSLYHGRNVTWSSIYRSSYIRP